MVAPSDHTSLRTPLRGSAVRFSGGDHGTDMPSAPASLCSMVAEMPKSVSAGCP